MRANPARVQRPVRRLRPAPCWKARKDGMAWIASANPEWTNPSGTPNIDALGLEMAVSRSSINRILTDPDWPPANSTTVLLAQGAAKAHGVPYLVAFHRIFRDPTVPQSRDNWFAKASTAEELVTAFVRHVSAYEVEKQAVAA